MSTCWKCGRPSPHGTAECEACESGLPVGGAVREAKFHAIDLNKIKTPEDVRELFNAMPMFLHISEDHPSFDKVKRFLKS